MNPPSPRLLKKLVSELIACVLADHCAECNLEIFGHFGFLCLLRVSGRGIGRIGLPLFISHFCVLGSIQAIFSCAPHFSVVAIIRTPFECDFTALFILTSHSLEVVGVLVSPTYFSFALRFDAFSIFRLEKGLTLSD